MAVRKMRRGIAVCAVLAGGVAGIVTVVVGGSGMAAQGRGPVQRTVVGKVVNKDGAGIKGAVVYLKDTRSTSVKSAFSEDDGSYRFVQLSQNTDYELYAKLGDKTSKSRSISSFDSKNDFTINLKIE